MMFTNMITIQFKYTLYNHPSQVKIVKKFTLSYKNYL